MRTTNRKPRAVTALGLLALLTAGLVACTPADEDEPATTPTQTSSGDASTQPPQDFECTPEEMPTIESNILTIATDQPAYEPWMVDDDPTNGEGFESAVAYAVAEELGYDRDHVVWTRVPFNAAIQPGPKAFDFDINQFTITRKRMRAVDFSAPYYTAVQAVVTTGTSPAAGATTLAELKPLRIGAQVATTSLDAVNDVIAPDAGAQVFNTNDDAKLALENGQVDAIVVDLPTAFFITSAELTDGKIVGQLRGTATDGDQFGLLMDKGSPLARCFTGAIISLRAAGTLEDLEEQWLSDVADAPILE